MATVQDVADLAGVSASTVSRVLNDHPYVTDATRSKVLAAMEELNYQPNRVARRLRMRQSQMIGLILSDISNPFFTSVVRGIEDVAYANEYSLILCNSDEDPDKEKLYVDVLIAEQVAGVIITPTDEESGAYDSFHKVGIPIVTMDRRWRRSEVDTVLVDNVKGAYLATEHLINLGHRRIGLIGGPSRITTGRQRQEGYEAALSKHGLPIDDDLIKTADFTQDGGCEGALRLLAMKDPPTAIFAANNLMTLGALNAAHRQRLRIPQDVAIVGFDDMAWAPSLEPPLTAVAQPTYELGSLAADALLKRIEDPDRDFTEQMLDPRLIVRESCGQTSDKNQP